MMISSLIIPLGAAINEIIFDGNPITGTVTTGEIFSRKIIYDTDLGGLAALGVAMKSSTLLKLSFVSCQMGPVGLTALSDAISLSAALSLVNVMDNPGIDAEHNLDLFEQLCRMLIKIDPTHLPIGGIGAGPDALKRLATLFTPDSEFTAAIRGVNLANNDAITGKRSKDNDGQAPWIYGEEMKGFTKLCQLMSSSPIEELNVSGCEITPTSLSTLAKFISDSAALSTLNLCDNANINVADIEAVKIAAPNVSIEH